MIVALFFLLLSSSVYANSAFEAGLLEYNKENWSGAIEAWKGITESGQTSAELEYNLGNAFFRKGVLERSILHYERSLKLKPSDEDTRKNLGLANRGIVDQIAHAPTLGIFDYLHALRDSMSVSAAKNLLMAANALLALAVGCYFYSKGRLQDVFRRVIVVFAGSTIVLLLMYSWRSSAHADTSAIIMVEKTDVYSSPTENSTQLFSLHSGTKVRLGEALSSWTEIELADGRKGWIPSVYIEII